MMNAERTLAPALGWFGIAIGALEMAAPKTVARAIGTDNGATVLRAFGAREIGAGFAVLSRRKPAPALWIRVAGDALDLAGLARAMGDERNDRSRLRFAMAAVAAVTLVDVYAALATGRPQAQKRPAISKSVAFMASTEELLGVLRDPSWVPRYVPGLAKAKVELCHPERSDAERARAVEVEQSRRPSEQVHYRIAGVGRLSGSLQITLSDLGYDRGTRLRLEVLSPGARVSGRLVRALAEIPGDALSIGLHRLKNIVEVGEVVSNDGPSGRHGKKVRP